MSAPSTGTLGTSLGTIVGEGSCGGGRVLPLPPRVPPSEEPSLGDEACGLGSGVVSELPWQMPSLPREARMHGYQLVQRHKGSQVLTIVTSKVDAKRFRNITLDIRRGNEDGGFERSTRS